MMIRLPERILGKVAGWRRVLFFRGVKPSEPVELRGRLVLANPETIQNWIEKLPDFPWTRDVVEARARQGHQLYALLLQEAPVCYGWVSNRSSFEIGELSGTCDLGKSTLWIWDCVTPPGHRNRGYYTAFLTALLVETGSQNPVIYCDSKNGPSRRAIEKSGFVAFASVIRSRPGHPSVSPGFADALSPLEVKPLRIKRGHGRIVILTSSLRGPKVRSNLPVCRLLRTFGPRNDGSENPTHAKRS